MVARRPSDKQSGQLNAILDAAEAVVLRDGMGRLTLEAVATRAGLSKAGLLHHVPSKDAMITAMVERQVRQWQEEFRRTYAEQLATGTRCPAVSSMMATCMAGTETWTESERARNRVLVAALVHDERQVEPMRKVHREMERLLKRDDLEPGVGDTIHLAIHGLWFQWIFGMGDVSPARLKAIRNVLRALGDLEREGTGAKAVAGGRGASVMKAVRGAKGAIAAKVKGDSKAKTVTKTRGAATGNAKSGGGVAGGAAASGGAKIGSRVSAKRGGH
ncbi:MAG: TetR/AcrR family transcriptional regulator [Phycisphaerales bacterium]|nr:TetR/AcrR family transcriptional regulator [Phycisphaerales bacterium]